MKHSTPKTHLAETRTAPALSCSGEEGWAAAAIARHHSVQLKYPHGTRKHKLSPPAALPHLCLVLLEQLRALELEGGGQQVSLNAPHAAGKQAVHGSCVVGTLRLSTAESGTSCTMEKHPRHLTEGTSRPVSMQDCLPPRLLPHSRGLQVHRLDHLKALELVTLGGGHQLLEVSM
jgi:hypothetical protein